MAGVGHNLIWIPGDGWESYVHGQVGFGEEADFHVGVGVVVNIQNHEDFEGSYVNLSVMVPTQYGSFGMDVSTWPESPTAISIIYGVGGGASVNYQFYGITEDVAGEIQDAIEDWLDELFPEEDD